MGRKERRAEHSRQRHALANDGFSFQDDLDAAMAHHQAGRLDEAETLYREILGNAPNSIDCLHLLGLINLQRGDPQTAVTLIGKAIAVNGKVAAFHYNIANAYMNLNATDDAKAHYETALALQPSYAEAANNLGFILLNRKDPEKASACFAKALKAKPDYAEAHNNLGLAFKDMGNFEKAAYHFERAVLVKPDYLHALNNMGMIQRALGRPDKAIPIYERALQLQPHYVEACNNLGNALRDVGKLDLAKKALERALDIAPQHAEAYCNLGNVLKDLEKPDEALALYERALAFNPRLAMAHYNMGTTYQERGLHNEAMACYERSLSIDPDYGDALWNQSLLFLLKGDYEKGWKQYERRWLVKWVGDHGYRAPLWDGSPLDGKTILLHCEQGLGDSIQFVRYAPLVKESGGRVILACPRALARIFQSVAGTDCVIEEGETVPKHDCRAPLMSLPLIFNTKLDTIPAQVPYLSPRPEDVARWAEKLKPFAGIKVGLVWAGEPRIMLAELNAVDRRRSMSLEQFAPLAGVPDAHFFSLQKGEPAKQAINPPEGLTLIDFMDEATDFADTAALIANLDLVIGVDTSVIHMAGALAKPTWVLSRFDGCWRWLLDRDDSPWYPTLRLFRQTRTGAWENVVQNVRSALIMLQLERLRQSVKS